MNFKNSYKIFGLWPIPPSSRIYYYIVMDGSKFQEENKFELSLKSYFKIQVSEMSPSSFSFIMATGIVSIIAHHLGLRELSTALSWINIISFPVLWLLFLTRVASFPKSVIADCKNHQRAYGYFTMVASAGIFGAQVIIIHQLPKIAEALWWIAIILWFVCTYSVFTALITLKNKPTLKDGIDGGWLLAVVATQSICVLGCLLNKELLGNKEITLFMLTAFWLCGGMLYLWIISLIFHRYMFFPFSPRDLMPPYWINMGAVAISTLAGVLLLRATENSITLSTLYPFILGFTIMFWATATWWIPMLVILSIWRHFSQKIPITYDPLYWGLVFPFGMYSACTYQLSIVLNAPFLLQVSQITMTAAAVVWLLTFLGAIGWLIRTPLFIRELSNGRTYKEVDILNSNMNNIGESYEP